MQRLPRGIGTGRVICTLINGIECARSGNNRAPDSKAALLLDIVNRHGGDVTLVHLPEIGIHGNTHFLMSDLNNLQIADQVSNFLSEKKLG